MGHALGVVRSYLGLTREMLFLSTKAGFLSQADADSLLQSRAIDAGDLVQGMHCLHPACLDFSLKRSLARMNVGTVRFCFNSACMLWMGLAGSIARGVRDVGTLRRLCLTCSTLICPGDDGSCIMACQARWLSRVTSYCS